MDKETSSRVSTIASEILQIASPEAGDQISPGSYNLLLDKAKTLAGSALAQDQTAGQNVSRSSDIRNFQILIHSTEHGLSFGFQWSDRAYNASVPHEASPVNVVSALANLGVMITRYELEKENG